jgi:hypothetical protein
MNWSASSRLFIVLAETIKDNVADESVRKCIYAEMIDHFEDSGCDALHVCADIDPLLDEILKDRGILPDIDDDEIWPDGG